MCESSAPPHPISAAQSLLDDGFPPGAAARVAAGNAGEDGQKLNQAMRQAHNGKEAATAVFNSGP